MICWTLLVIRRNIVLEVFWIDGLILRIFGGMCEVYETPFLQKIVNGNYGTGISRQTFSGHERSNKLKLCQFDNVVAIFPVEVLVLFELYVGLNKKSGTIVAGKPFLTLNHSGMAFFSMS